MVLASRLARLAYRARLPWIGLSEMQPTLRYAPQVIGALAVVLVLVGGYFWAYGNGRDAERARWDRANAEAAERFNEALAEQQKRVTQLDAELRRARRSRTEQREALSDAMAIDVDWSTSPVPLGVRAALERNTALPANTARAD